MMGGFVAAIRSLTNPQGESHQAMSMRRWLKVNQEQASGNHP